MARITVTSTFNLNEINVETQSSTLGELLEELTRKKLLSNVQFFDPWTGEVYPDCDVHLNGQPYGTLAEGLDTRLSDGDRVEIIQFTLAGG